MSTTLVCVEPAKAPEIWPHVRDMLARAFSIGRADDTIESVESSVLAGRSLLWIAWDSVAKEILAAATTMLTQVPTAKVCIVTSCGGRSNEQQWGARWQGLLDGIERYAAAECCDAMRIYGRPGWQRVLKGYSQPWITLEKRLAHAG